MKTSILLAAILVCAAFASAGHAEGETAPPQAGPQPVPATRACLPANRIGSWSLIDDRHVYLSMLNKRHRFLVTFLGPCKAAKWAMIVQLWRGSVGKCLWAGDQLIFRRTPFEISGVCWIDKIEPAPLSAAEEAELERAWSRPRRSEPQRPPTF